jgi:hypothetical protein
MRLGEKVLSISVIVAGVIFFICGSLVLSSSFAADTGERDIVSMTKTVSVVNSPQVYDSIAFKIKTSQPFKVCVLAYTSAGEYWINYSSAYTGSPQYDDETDMIEAEVGSNVTDGQWNTVELNIQVTLEEDALTVGHAPWSLGSIEKISILGSDFGLRYVNVFYTDTDGSKKYQPLDKYQYGSDNFGLPDITPPGYQKNWIGWDLTNPEYFSIQYDENLLGYLQAEGPLQQSSSEDSSNLSRSSAAVISSPTDLGSSYFSPYSAFGGYYDNYYGPSYGGYYGGLYGGLGYGYGGYPYGLGYGAFGMGYGGYGLGGLGGLGYGLGGYGLPGLGGLGGYGLGGYGYPFPTYGIGYGLGGYGLPYSSYGYPYSLYGGALGSPLGAGITSLLDGTGLGLSSLLTGSSLLGNTGLLSGLSNLPTNTVSIPTLVPTTSQVSLSSLLGLGSLGITGLSNLTIPVTTYAPGSSTVTLPNLSSLLSSTTTAI